MNKTKQDYLDYISERGFDCISKRLELLWDYPEIREAFRRLVGLGESNPSDPKLPDGVQCAILQLYNLRFEQPEESVCPWDRTLYR